MTESPEPVIYQYSVKIEMGSKGEAKPTVHVYGNDESIVREEAARLYHQTILELVNRKLPVAVELKL